MSNFPPNRSNSCSRGKEKRGRDPTVQADAGRALPWGGTPGYGREIYGSPPAAGHLPKTQVRGRAGQLTWKGGAVPTGRPGCRPVTRAYLGFELFQKTVWRLAAARLQHRPKREAQRNSIARGLARPGGDEGVLRVWIPAGFLGSAVSTALAALASRLRDSAFWAGAARHPAPPPPRPARGCPGPGGWGGGGGEGRGEQGEGSGARTSTR